MTQERHQQCGAGEPDHHEWRWPLPTVGGAREKLEQLEQGCDWSSAAGWSASSASSVALFIYTSVLGHPLEFLVSPLSRPLCASLLFLSFFSFSFVFVFFFARFSCGGRVRVLFRTTRSCSGSGRFFFRVFLAFTGFYWVLLGFTGFY